MHVDGNGGEGGEPQRCYAAWCRPSLRPLRTACAPLLAALRVELRGSTAATTTTTSSSSSGAQNGHGAPTTGGFGDGANSSSSNNSSGGGGSLSGSLSGSGSASANAARVGPAIRDLRVRDCVEALEAMRRRGQRPRLGSLQRWVRECDAWCSRWTCTNPQCSGCAACH